ncbi:hypothetical protein GALL_411990 [mine drainage metagenome]|uniref:SWIM-type domain-containing protein n=1 Tax=mine drainage metagenome TaxID=410659 RepID=A0A1J5Q1G9_9ZZZZ
MAVSLSQHFDRATLERAEGYFRAGHVVSVAADQRGGVESEVRNARGEVYRQTTEIEAPSARHPKGRINGLCTCPMQSNCKHVAAALFALASGEARPPAPAVPTLSGPVQSWLRRARTLRETSAPPDPLLEPRPDDYPAAIKDRLCYVLDTLQPGLRIDLYKGRVNAQGTGLTKAMRRYDLLYRLRSDGAGAGFLRPVDLDLVGQLARARLLTGQPTYGYDLPEALQSRTTAGAALMRALCATGRLFGDAQPEAVLVWAEAAFPTTLGWAVAPDGSQRLSFVSPTGDPLEVAPFGAESLWVDRRTAQIGRSRAAAKQRYQQGRDRQSRHTRGPVIHSARP